MVTDSEGREIVATIPDASLMGGPLFVSYDGDDVFITGSHETESVRIALTWSEATQLIAGLLKASEAASPE